MTARISMIPILIATLAIAPVSMTIAQDNAPIETNTTQQSLAPAPGLQGKGAQKRLEMLKKVALESVKPLEKDEVKVLRAVIMDVTGRVQWRANSKAPWKKATKDDIIQPGAIIRTGLRSWMLLRVGLNANILIDSGSRVSLPQMVHAGDVLRTAIQVNRGRADLQVGQVGLTNDFSVLTPSGALAVRGTGMAVSHSALKGTQVVGARTNAMNAIAMKYYGSKVQHLMSGSAMSTQSAPDPAAAEAFQTAGPPPLIAAEAQDLQDAPDQTTQAISNSDPINQSTRILLADQQESAQEEIIDDILPPVDVFDLAGSSWYFDHEHGGVNPITEQLFSNGVLIPEDRGAVATGLYWDFKLETVPTHVDPYNPHGHRIAANFENGLYTETGFYDPSREQYLHEHDGTMVLHVPWGVPLPTGGTSLATTYQNILDYGHAHWSGQPFTGSQDLQAMAASINTFCMQTFDGNGEQIEVCRAAFAQAIDGLLYNEQQGLTPYGYGLQDPTYGDNVEYGDDCPFCP